MRDFELIEPSSVREACAALAEDPAGSLILAGGTDVLVDLKAGIREPYRLVSLRRIDELRGVQLGADGSLSIGAMATINMVARHAGVANAFPGIVDAARSLAAEQVRNQATVVGNLCMAVPSADMAPILLAHDARLTIVSPSGERCVHLGEFFVGPRSTILEPAELVVRVEVVPPQPATGGASVRQGGRASLSLPIAATAAVVVMDGDVCRQVSLGLGAVAPTPIVARGVADVVVGKRLTGEVLHAAGEAAAAAARPISDLRASKDYRLKLVRVLTRRVLTTAAERSAWNE